MKAKHCINSLNECFLLLKVRLKLKFLETKNINKYENKIYSKKQMRKEIQQLYNYVNCLSSNNLVVVTMRHHFVGHKFNKDLQNQFERPLKNRLYKWRKMFNLHCYQNIQ